MDYIEGHTTEPGCLFCNRSGMEDGLDNLILYRGEKVFAILNRFPYTNGHMMVVPYEHTSTIESLDNAVQLELMTMTSAAIGILRSAYRAEAFNVGINIGEAAGAGIAEHVHIHIVPRWSGDTNFMATTAASRVLPESLKVTYAKLRECWLALKAT